MRAPRKSRIFFIIIMFISFTPDGISRLRNVACCYYRYSLLSETPELFLKWKKKSNHSTWCSRSKVSWEINHGITHLQSSKYSTNIKLIAAEIFIFSLENDSLPFVLRLHPLHSDVKENVERALKTIIPFQREN